MEGTQPVVVKHNTLRIVAAVVLLVILIIVVPLSALPREWVRGIYVAVSFIAVLLLLPLSWRNVRADVENSLFDPLLQGAIMIGLLATFLKPTVDRQAIFDAFYYIAFGGAFALAGVNLLAILLQRWYVGVLLLIAPFLGAFLAATPWLPSLCGVVIGAVAVKIAPLPRFALKTITGGWALLSVLMFLASLPLVHRAVNVPQMAASVTMMTMASTTLLLRPWSYRKVPDSTPAVQPGA